MKLPDRFISRPILFCLAAGILLAGFFELWRLIFLLSLEPTESGIPANVLAEAFWVGLRFDLAVTAYILLPLLLISGVAGVGVARTFVMRWLVNGVLVVAAAATFFIHLVDIEFFAAFNQRVNGVALQWADTPSFMFTMLWETYPVIAYLLLYAVVLILFLWMLGRLRAAILKPDVRSRWWVHLVWLVPSLALAAIAARGRLEEKAPLTWGVAYFSSYDTANQLALNPTFTFLRDAVYDRGSQEAAQELMEALRFPQAHTIVRELLGLEPLPEGADPKRIARVVRPQGDAEEPPNIVVIIMESFGSSHIGVLDNRLPYDLSPQFDSLSRVGVLFTNAYSTGAHTYTGILGTLFGYPTVYGKSIMKQLAGQHRFVGLPTVLQENGYTTLFFTTHDPHFDNMQGFLVANGVEQVFGLGDYDPDKKLSTLGVPDHVMFDRALEELQARKGNRLFAALLTSSNHGPWLVPDVPFGPLPSDTADYKRLNAFKYSDWALGRFVAALADDPEFANTIVLVTSDNGMRYQAQVDLDPSQYRVPVLLLDLDNLTDSAGRRRDQVASQLDIAATLLARTGLAWPNYTFGRDLLDTTGVQFAQFSEWDRIGFVQDDYYHITRLEGPESMYRIDGSTGLLDTSEDLAGSEPVLARLYGSRGLAVFVEAYFNMFRPLSD